MVIKPFSIPIDLFNTYAKGAKQLVVHEAFDKIWCSLEIFLWFTPYTTVRSTPLAGADIRTFFAPAVMCCWAFSLLVKIPVHSKTTSTSNSFQGKFSGFLSEVTLIGPVPTSRSLPLIITSLLRMPWTESYFNKCAFVSIGPKSLMPTTLILWFLFSIIDLSIFPVSYTHLRAHET